MPKIVKFPEKQERKQRKLSFKDLEPEDLDNYEGPFSGRYDQFKVNLIPYWTTLWVLLGLAIFWFAGITYLI